METVVGIFKLFSLMFRTSLPNFIHLKALQMSYMVCFQLSLGLQCSITIYQEDYKITRRFSDLRTFFFLWVYTEIHEKLPKVGIWFDLFFFFAIAFEIFSCSFHRGACKIKRSNKIKTPCEEYIHSYPVSQRASCCPLHNE